VRLRSPVLSAPRAGRARRPARSIRRVARPWAGERWHRAAVLGGMRGHACRAGARWAVRAVSRRTRGRPVRPGAGAMARRRRPVRPCNGRGSAGRHRGHRRAPAGSRSGVVAPLQGGVAHEAERLAQLGIPKNNEVWRPSQADFDSAAFMVIVGGPKLTPGGIPKSTILAAHLAGIRKSKVAQACWIRAISFGSRRTDR
jgi:hypothetical protein